MDRFAEFLTMARETRRNCIAPRSQSTYQGYVDAYAHTMATEFQIDAFPLTEEKISGFLMFFKDKGEMLRDSTVLCYGFFLVFSNKRLRQSGKFGVFQTVQGGSKEGHAWRQVSASESSFPVRFLSSNSPNFTHAIEG